MANGTPLGNIVVKLGLDSSSFGDGLAAANRATRYFTNEVKAMDNMMKLSGKSSDGLGAKQASLKNAIEAQSKALKVLKEDLKNAEPGTAKYETLANKIQTANVKLASYQAQLQSAAREIARYRVETEGATGVLNRFGDGALTAGKKLDGVGRGMSSIGGTLNKSVTVPIMAIGAAAIKASIDYESAFAGVKKTVDEAVDANGKVIISYDDLSNGIRAMAKELPASASEIAAVAEVAGQLGIKTEDVLKFSRTMIDLGESTNLSATDAATAIAKIANITGMTSDEYQRFGSAVTALGNNFATTESDVVSMTNRLASAGKLAGLTNQEILGLATAMSSVGIEAEAGGTAMTQTLTVIEKAAVMGVSAIGDLEQRANAAGLSFNDVATAVYKGGSALKKTAAQMGMSNTELRKMYEDAGKASESLSQFADIAGMSSEQFAMSWKNKPIEAIQAFIKGLGQLEGKGESATLVLDEMGLEGIRQSNMLKSLALASDTLTGAVDTSTKAWNENSALTSEANKRYETTESKLKMLKNEVTDVAIEFGGPLVDAMRDGVQAAKPVIEFLGDMSKKFSSLDREQQQNIIKWGLIAASVGPTLSIFGKIISITGKATTGVGTFSKGVVELIAKASEKRAIAGLATEVTAVGTSAASSATSIGAAATKTGELGKLLPMLVSPVGAVVGATALLTGGLVAYSMHQDAARRETEKWGVKLSNTADNELTKFKVQVDNTSDAIIGFEAGAVTADKVGEAFKKMYSEIEKAGQDADKRLEEAAQRAGLTDEQIAKGKETNAQFVKNAQMMSDQVVAIYQKHNGDTSKLTAEEKEIVLNNQREMITAQLDLMNLSKSEKKNILTAMNGDVNSLNRTQLESTTTHIAKLMSEENKSYKQQKDDLDELFAKKSLSQEEYNAKSQAASAQHNANMETYGKKYISAMEALDRAMQASGIDKTATGIWQKTRETLEKYGDGMYDKIIAKSHEAGQAIGASSSMIAKYTDDMSAEGKAAKDQWNALVFDPKTGELKQNAKEEVAKALQAEDGWQRMGFVVKNAELTTNARETIAQALIANGKWENLYPGEKELLFRNEEGMQAIYESKEMLATWTAMPDPIKKMLANNKDFMTKSEAAKTEIDAWNALSPREQELRAKNATKTSVFDAQNTINSLTGLQVDLTASNKTAPDKDAAQFTVNSLYGKTVDLNASNQTFAGKNAAQGTVNSLLGKTVDLFSNNLAGAGKDSAQGTVNLFGGKTVDLTASDLTNIGVSNAESTIARLPSEKNIVLNFLTGGNKLERGTNYHDGGVAMVNDQKGSLYKEMVTLPNGQSFVPEGRNVLLDLPRGSKVLTASKTAPLIPRYAKGVGPQRIPLNSKIFKDIAKVKMVMNKTTFFQQNTDGSALKALADALKNLKQQEVVQKIVIENVTWTGKEDISKLLEQLANQEIINARGAFG